MKKRKSLPIRLARHVLCQLAIILIGACSAAAVVPVDLRCEYLSDPIGVDVAVPRLSWKLADADALRGQKQTAWQIRAASRPDRLAEGQADLWDSGVVRSSQSVLVPYGGESLTSNQTVYRIEFYGAQRKNRLDGGQTWDLRVDDKTIASFAPSADQTTYAPYQATFTASASKHTLRFVGTNRNGGDSTVFLDAVKLSAVEK